MKNTIENECLLKRPLWIVALVTCLVVIGISALIIGVESFEVYLMRDDSLLWGYRIEPSISYKTKAYISIVISIAAFTISIGLWKMKKWGSILYGTLILPIAAILITDFLELGKAVSIVLVLFLIAAGINLIDLWQNKKLT